MRKLNCIFILPALAGPAFAQISWATCTVEGYEWSYNSLGQNPCAVAAYLVSPCNDGTFNLSAISSGWVYVGPTSLVEDVCLCNTVVYSLYSACAACQGAGWISWSRWASNCSSVSPPTTYSPVIQNWMRVPYWAYLDVTTTNDWNATLAQLAGDFPESMAGASSTEATLRPFSTTTTSESSTSTPVSMASTVAQSNSSSSSLHSGQIAGASVGALVGVSLLIGIVSWYLRRWRSRAKLQPARFSYSVKRIARTSDLLDPSHSTTIGRNYHDPSDPNTFPETGTQTAHNQGNFFYTDESIDSNGRPRLSRLVVV